MRFVFRLVMAILCLAPATNAFALGSDFSAKQIAEVSKHCVHGYWVNELTSYYYRGDVAAFHAEIKKLDESPLPVTWASRQVILRIGPKKAASPWDKAARDIATDWQITTWIGEEPPAADGSLPRHQKIEIWLGGNLKLEELKIPEGCEVISGREIDGFLAKRKASD
jgi:hypothetical protein